MMSEVRDRQLIEAVQAKKLEAVKAALAAGANPNLSIKTEAGEQTLLEFTQYDRDIKYALIEAGAEGKSLRYQLVDVISHGATHLVPLLIAKGADVNGSSYSGSPLYAAIKQGDPQLIQQLLDAGADPDTGSSFGTPLFEAIEQDQPEIALQLLAAGANPNECPEFSSTPAIALAAAKSKLDVLEAMLVAGADVNAPVAHITLNQPQVHQQAGEVLGSLFSVTETVGKAMDSNSEAEMQGALESLNQLKAAEQKQKKIEPIQITQTTPALLAVRLGRAGALGLLLSMGADQSCKDAEGLSLFDWATHNNDEAALNILALHGITSSQVSPDELLLQGAETGDLAQVQAALEQGAEIDTRDARQKTKEQTPLMLAATANHLDVVECLLDAGADPNLEADFFESLEDQFGRGYNYTALMLATRADSNPDIITTLLEKGASINNSRNPKSSPALWLGAIRGRLDIVQILLQWGADINQQDREGCTPLMQAIENNHPELVQFLLQSGADINIKTDEGNTCLMQAAGKCDLELVRQLIVQGADVNAPGYLPGPALVCAAQAEYWIDLQPGQEPMWGRHIEYNDNGRRELRPYPDEQILAVMDVLLEAGADPNLGEGDETALMTIMYGGTLAGIKRLLDAGTDLTVRDREGRTVFGLAEIFQGEETLALLREYAGDRAAELEKTIAPPEEEDDSEDRWGPEIEQPDFSDRGKAPEFLAAIKDLEEICGNKAIPWREGTFKVAVRAKKRRDIDTETLQQQFIERGCFLVESDSGIFQDGPQQLIILPTTDKYEAIATFQTNGCNCGIGPGYVIEWLKELEAEQPFVITTIRHDLLDGRFLTPIQDPEGWAEKMYDFCPDIVDQGVGSVENLAASLRESDNLYFWWD